MLGFARNVARWGLPARSLLFGPLSLGDDLLCTAVLREARKRGLPFAMMTARPELFLGNPDPERVIPVDDDFAAGLRRLGKTVVKPYYVGAHPADSACDLLPGRHIVAEMCAQAGLAGEVALRPYLHLTEAERAAGKKFARQLALHSTGLGAAIPYPAKEWSPERFAEVARQLAPEIKLVQLGAAGDPALPVDLDLRGKTRLREAAAVLAASEAFIGLEGFLTHLARAVDCPAVVVMGGRAPEGIFGYAANRNLYAHPECSPCTRRTGCPHAMQCMTAIAPADVLRSARELLADPPARPLAVESAVIP
jgi:ADP-heptose:LPS heptosyltransferase